MDDNSNLLEKNSIISSTPSNFSFYVMDFCQNDCDDEISDETIFAYLIVISYSGYKIDHQNTDIPLEKNNDKYTFKQEFYFSTERSSLFQVFWNVIKYKEEKGLLGLFDNFLNKKNEYFSVDIGKIEHIETKGIIENEYPENPSIKGRIFALINMNDRRNQYIEYIRNKKSI